MLIKSLKKLQSGSILIESLIATVIFSMGVLAMVGLQSTLTKNSSDNQYRAQAIQIAQTHLANMASFGFTANEYVNSVNSSLVSRQLPSGELSFTADNNSLYTVTVRWQVPGSRRRTVQVSAYMYDAPRRKS